MASIICVPPCSTLISSAISRRIWRSSAFLPLVTNMCHLNLSELYVVGPTSKSSWCVFFWENWKKNQNWVYIGERTLYITAGSECHWITSPRSVQSVVQPDLECTHQEDDTRILLHVKHASIAGNIHTLLPSTGTDVLTLVVYVCLCCSSTEYRKIKHGAASALHPYHTGSNSMSWPPRYAFIRWMWLY